MQVSKNIRTHLVIMRDWEELRITHDQFKALEERKFNWKATELVEIRDIDSNEQMYYWELSWIKWFREIKIKDTSWIRYYCEFGISHQMEEKCTCSHKYNIDSLTFLLNMKDKFPNIKYAQDLTNEQRKEILEKNFWHT